MSCRELMRRKLLEEIYDKMSDEEKRAFVQLTFQNKDNEEIKQALDEIRKRQSWVYDFSSNVVGNAVWDSLVWLVKSIIKKV